MSHVALVLLQVFGALRAATAAEGAAAQPDVAAGAEPSADAGAAAAGAGAGAATAVAAAEADADAEADAFRVFVALNGALPADFYVPQLEGFQRGFEAAALLLEEAPP
eukprot:830684-Prymnesium_polylepis.1